MATVVRNAGLLRSASASWAAPVVGHYVLHVPAPHEGSTT